MKIIGRGVLYYTYDLPTDFEVRIKHTHYPECLGNIAKYWCSGCEEVCFLIQAFLCLIDLMITQHVLQSVGLGFESQR